MVADSLHVRACALVCFVRSRNNAGFAKHYNNFLNTYVLWNDYLETVNDLYKQINKQLNIFS